MKRSLKVLVAALAVLALLTACGTDPTTEPSTSPATNPATDPTDGENTVKPEQKVTIYIPDTMITVSPDGTEQITVQYVFEEGWQEKESFAVSVKIDDPQGILGGEANVMDLLRFTYGERSMVQETAGMSKIETVYDENGNSILQTTTYLMESTPYEKLEMTTTYDEFGRIVTQTNTVYTRGGTEQESVSETITFVYTQTDTGSEGQYVVGGTVHAKMIYDAHYRLTCKSTLLNGEEVTRMERAYDEAGNLIRVINYTNGQKVSENLYTYQAVEVSPAFAERMPQFNQAK